MSAKQLALHLQLQVRLAAPPSSRSPALTLGLLDMWAMVRDKRYMSRREKAWKRMGL